jgi:hypothetical protein
MATTTHPARLPAAAAAALLLATLLAAARPAAACRVTNVDVSLSSSPAGLSSTAYTAVRLARAGVCGLLCLRFTVLSHGALRSIGPAGRGCCNSCDRFPQLNCPAPAARVLGPPALARLPSKLICIEAKSIPPGLSSPPS